MKYNKLLVMLILFMLFLTAPFGAVSASSNLDNLVQDAKNKGTVLKWAISIEGSGDGKTRPWKEYNNAKDAYQKAINAINKSKPSNSSQLITTLEKDVYLHIERAMHYIDAITAGEKITEQKTRMQNLINKNVINDEVESAYHLLSAEIRKQGILLDRVYGKSTRDLIRSNYKHSAENVLNSIKYSVTVKMKINEMEEALKAGKTQEGTSLYHEVKALLPSVEKDSFATQLGSILEKLEAEYNLKNSSDTPSKVELTIPQIKEALTTEAKKHNIPPEIMKGIALTENGGLKQFNADGTPFISFDGGIGIMQVTLADSDMRYDRERLKYDTRYNIQVGAEILLEKWNYGGKRIPTVNNNEIHILENWYFAIMAYNGLLSRNDPNKSASTYQSRVYNNIIKYTGIDSISNPDGNIQITYDESGKQLFTSKMAYQTTQKTKSTQQYKAGETVKLTTGGNLRQQPNTSGNYEKLVPGTEVEIVDGLFEDNNLYNLFSWYKVKVVGTNKVGYIASSNLQ